MVKKHVGFKKTFYKQRWNISILSLVQNIWLESRFPIFLDARYQMPFIFIQKSVPEHQILNLLKIKKWCSRVDFIAFEVSLDLSQMVLQRKNAIGIAKSWMSVCYWDIHQSKDKFNTGLKFWYRTHTKDEYESFWNQQ